MPRPALDYTPRPYVKPAYEPDTRTLMDLMRLAGASQADAVGRKGQIKAQGLMNLGHLISNALASHRQEGERQTLQAQKQSEADRDESFRRDQLASVEADRVERRQLAEQAAKDKQQADQYRRGAETAEEVGYGPMSEQQMTDVLPGPAGGRARYVFGPGTADGPELQPTKAQQRGIETEHAIKGMGGMIGPNGQVIMPPREPVTPTPESRLSGEDLLAYLAAQGNEGAKRALAVKRAQRPPQQPGSEPLMQVVGPDGKTRYGTRSQALGQIVPAGQNKPATGLEKRALAFFNRAQQADNDLEPLEAEVQKLGLAGQTYMQWAPNFAQTELGQQYTQAQRAFTEARLRKDSGAAIPDAEFENDRKTYFAQPGDSKDTLEQKRRARGAVLASLGFESGQALGEFVGDSEEARRIVDGYKSRAAKPTGKGFSVTAPDGSVHAFDSQAQADAFKKLIGG